MTANRSSMPLERWSRGFGLVEVMVGLVIGLIAVLVVYQVYSVAEGFKRNTTAAGEAQMNGLFSTFVLGMELANGGGGVATAAVDLGSCADPTTFPATDPRHFAQSFRPIPALIYAGANAAAPDSFIVNYSVATTLSGVAQFNVGGASDQPYQVQSPGGFHAGDLIIGVEDPGNADIPPTGNCASSKISGVPNLTTPDALWVDFYGAIKPVGNATIAHGAVMKTGPNAGFTFTGMCATNQGHDPPLVGSNPPVTTGEPFCPYKQGSTLFNMGPADRAQKVLYQVKNGGVLYSTPLLDSNGCPFGVAGCAATAVENPLASNIVTMKVEYGIADPLDPLGLLNTWKQASDVGWDAATLLPAPITQINLIKAIRIGLIVQSEQFDKSLAGFTGGDYTSGDYNWVLFDCPAHDNTCPGRLTGTVPASTSPAGNWRFRKYETIIPLRNAIWNKKS
jgi:type IV pilus assembly protein PilW